MRTFSLATGIITMLGISTGSVLRSTAVSAVTAHTVSTTNLGYTPLPSPMRIADTRLGATDPSTYAGETLGPGGTLTIDIPAGAGLPADAGAVVGQLTAIDTTASGYLSIYPVGSTNPGTANVPFVAGQTVGNLVTVALGTDASTGALAVTLFNASGSTDVTFDLYGYYATQSATSGDAYVPLMPARIYDSRAGSGEPGAGTTLGTGDTDTITVAGAGEVPTGANAAVLNLAVTDTTASGYVQCYPTGSAPSVSSPTVNVNFNPGETLSTQMILGLPTSGTITCKNAAGSADIVIDVDGYYTAPGGTGALFNAFATPVRVEDSRTLPTAPAAESTTAVTVSGMNGVATNATAVIWNLTDIAYGQNYLTAYPTGSPLPLAATVNWTTGDPSSTLSNGVYGTVGTSGVVDIYVGTSPADFVVDEFGYFAAAAPSPGTIGIAANPPSILANGISTSVVSATVITFAGVPVPGDTVKFTATGYPVGACAPLPSTAMAGVLTNGSGQASFTYISSITAGFCMITATEQETGASGSTVIEQTQP